MRYAHRDTLIGFILGVAAGLVVLALLKGCSPPIRFPSIKVPPPTSRPVDCPAPPAVRVAR